MSQKTTKSLSGNVPESPDTVKIKDQSEFTKTKDDIDCDGSPPQVFSERTDELSYVGDSKIIEPDQLASTIPINSSHEKGNTIGDLMDQFADTVVIENTQQRGTYLIMLI